MPHVPLLNFSSHRFHCVNLMLSVEQRDEPRNFSYLLPVLVDLTGIDLGGIGFAGRAKRADNVLQ